ncbi:MULTISPECIES: A1S_2505 family phage non-structural protein [unclassified Calothrix]|uniref:A1S_2505 family phage non-structural protein n=1 Tax=unclassified Calothrix TaxID=2619626 RepID=UPI0018EF7405|nr:MULTISPECIES: hypothetical protein [unclassified Calothrix]
MFITTTTVRFYSVSSINKEVNILGAKGEIVSTVKVKVPTLVGHETTYYANTLPDTSGIGFAKYCSLPRGKKSNRKKIAKLSRKINRKPKSVSKAPKKWSLLTKQVGRVVREMFDELDLSIRIKEELDIPKPILKKDKPVKTFEKPILKKDRKPVEKPILRKEEVIVRKTGGLPTILESLKEVRKEKKSIKGRTCVGKKFKDKPRSTNRVSKSAAKARSGKKCLLVESFLNKSIIEAASNNHWQELVNLAENYGYVVEFSDLDEAGYIQKDIKVIHIKDTFNNQGALAEYILAHELVHLGQDNGVFPKEMPLDELKELVGEEASIDAEAVLGEMKRLFADSYYEELGIKTLKELLPNDESVAYYLMFNPELVIKEMKYTLKARVACGSLSYRIAPEEIKTILPNQVFVFGSNTQGRHGKGAAKLARDKFGAIYGQARGLQGQSYAIVTKDLTKGGVPLESIKKEIDIFLTFATEHPELEFLVTKLGCGLAGYAVKEIATLFADKYIPSNVLLPREFVDYLTSTTTGKESDDSVVGDISLNPFGVVEDNNMKYALVNDPKMPKEEAIALFEEIIKDERLDLIDSMWLNRSMESYQTWTNTTLQFYARVLASYLNANSTPFPRWLAKYDAIVLVDSVNSLTKIKTIKEFGIPLYSALWDGKEKKLKPSKSYQTYGVLEYQYDTRQPNTLYLSSRSKCPWVRPLEWLDAAHITKISESLSNHEKAEFLSGFSSFKLIEPGVLTLSPSGITAGYSEAIFDFNNAVIKTGRDHNVRSQGFLGGVGVMTNTTLMVLLGLQIGKLNQWSVGQTTLDGIVAGLTQLWEEQDLYGQVMDTNQELRTIRENTCSLLKVSPDPIFPYFRLENNNSKDGVAEAVEYFSIKRIPFMTDKNAMKRIVIGAGVTALCVAMDFDLDIFSTILDVKKPGKVLNRGWNKIAIAAEQGLDFQDGYQPYEQAGLVLKHISEEGEETDIVVKGDKAMTLTHDGRFLTNGSGVGLTRKKFAYSARKTLRATFNAVSLKKDESLDSVKAEIEKELMAILASDKVITHNSKHKDKVIFKFRGKELIKYRGLNQDIILSSKYGCSFQVRKLATSKSLSIQLTVVYFASDYEIKGRGIGIKAVLKDGRKVSISRRDGSDLNWEVALNSECLKGNAARLHQYCEWLLEQTGKSSYLVTDYQTKEFERLHTPSLTEEGVYDVQDLADETCHFYKWWEGRSESYFIRDYVDYENYFQTLVLGHAKMGNKGDYSLVEKALSHEANAVITLINLKTGKPTNKIQEALTEDGLVLIEERVTGVLAPYTFQVEMATTRETTVAAQSPTLQQLCSAYAAYPSLGYALLENAQETEDAIIGCAAMALNDPTLLDLNNSGELSVEGKDWEVGSKDISAKEIAESLNPSMFSMGYANIYGESDDPFLAFSEPGTDKKFKPSVLVNQVGINAPMEGGKVDFSVRDVIEGTAWNYQVNVGSGYNMSSVMACVAAMTRYEWIKASKAKDKVAFAKAMEKMKLVAKVQGMCWLTGYEDSWLCGYNLKGMELANKLHMFRKGYVAKSKDNEEVNFSAVIEQIKGQLEKIANTKFSDNEVIMFLWAYRIARAISALEKYTSGPEGVAKAFNLTDEGVEDKEDLDMVALCGAMRRCDQGRFANFLTPEEEDNSEAGGISVWMFLRERWVDVQNKVPYFLRRKIYKSMIVQTEFADLTRNISAAGDETSLRKNESPRVKRKPTANAGESRVLVTLPDADIDLPFIPLEYSSVDEDNYGTVVSGSTEFLKFKQLGGAFEVVRRFCPIGEDGKRDTKYRKADATKVLKSVYKVTDFNGTEYQFDETLHFWTEALSAEETLKMAHNRYPNGCVICSIDGKNPDKETDLEVYFNFGALLKSAAFMGGGSSTGIGLSIVELLHGMVDRYENRPKNWTTKARNALAGIQGQMREMLKAGLLRRIGRTEPFAQGGKVMSSHSCPNEIVTHEGVEYSIPVVKMNPNDDIVKVGGYIEGSVVAVYRTPQIAKLYCIVVMDENVSLGHIEVNALLWAKSNRGDGDGK